MGRLARLTHTSNPSLQKYVGTLGELSRSPNGGYEFYMKSVEQTIRTSPANPSTVLGDVDYPVCRNIGFETYSGSMYSFDFADVERLVDGTRMVDNHFVGFEDGFQAGDSVYTHDGHTGKITDLNRATGMCMVTVALGNDRFDLKAYRINDLRHVEMSDRINAAAHKADAHNLNSSAFAKDDADKGYEY